MNAVFRDGNNHPPVFKYQVDLVDASSTCGEVVLIIQALSVCTRCEKKWGEVKTSCGCTKKYCCNENIGQCIVIHCKVRKQEWGMAAELGRGRGGGTFFL